MKTRISVCVASSQTLEEEECMCACVCNDTTGAMLNNTTGLTTLPANWGPRASTHLKLQLINRCHTFRIWTRFEYMKLLRILSKCVNFDHGIQHYHYSTIKK